MPRHDRIVDSVEQARLLQRWNEQTSTRCSSTTPMNLERTASVTTMAEQTEVRITLIRPDGVVLVDSENDPARMENHANREELKQAARAGQGSSIRLSETMKISFLYFAIPLKKDEKTVAFIRVAEQVQSIQDRMTKRKVSLWLLAFAVAMLAAPITYVFAGRIVQPLTELTANAQAIAAGEFEQTVTVRSRDEIGELAAAFGWMSKLNSLRMLELNEQNQRMSAVLSGMVEGVLAVDEDRRVIVANDACAKLLSIDWDDPIGRPLLEVFRNADLDKAVGEAMESRRTVERDIVMTGPPRRELRLFATALGDERPGVILVLHDITEIRRLENLRQEFVANVSHELKTPLASIKAYAETLKMGAVNDPDNNVKFVQRITEQSDRLNDLINDMLQLARVEAGQEVFRLESIALRSVVEQSVIQYQPLAEPKQIDLQLEAGDDSLHVWADNDGVRTILDNLLGNAIKYTPEDGRVDVRVFRDGDMGVVEVQDNGIGIDPGLHHRVFERFFRVDKARSMGGTGLGLSIVKHLCHAFGGSVELESPQGRGSLFRFRLPIQRADSSTGSS